MDDYITRSEHNEFVKRMEDEHLRINDRLSNHDKLSEQLHELVGSVGILAVNMENVLKEIQKQGERLEFIEETPNRTVSTFKTSVINAIGAAIGGAIVLGIAYFITL